eukprot:13284210-Heterocapsa_arctica.AAC.1
MPEPPSAFASPYAGVFVPPRGNKFPDWCKHSGYPVSCLFLPGRQEHVKTGAWAAASSSQI